LYLGQVKISQVVERLTGNSRLTQPKSTQLNSTQSNSTQSSDIAADSRSDGRESVRAAEVYGNGRGDLEFGECEVTIPRRHEPGMIERPSLWRLEFHESLDRHVVLRTVERRGEDAFFTAVRERVASSPSSDLFVFIHGYNVSFDMAARRTAQMAHDLKFDGAPIFYSWPSQGGLLKYPVDETNVAWTVPHLKQFLRQLAARSEARAINVIAHSMGNRALASAVRELSLEQPVTQKRFQQIVLAAPDIDAEVFKRDVAPLLASSAEHVTLYASSRDQALAASKLVHGYPRAGDSGSNLLVIPGIETVDVTEVDTGILGHSYYGNSVPILRDLEQILHGALTQEKRPWLQTAQRDGQSYWMFNDQSLAILRSPRHR
jgi:esterase/lipase superfamily enzyme